MSNIVQKRIAPKVDEYLASSQHAYRERKSTSDIVWSYRWIAAKMQKVESKVFVTGIDMTSAFDTIKRSNLLKILASFLEEDEMRMLRVILSNTSLELKMADVETVSFKSNIGSPQGDSLSGQLFDVYFENSLRKIRYKMINNAPLIEHSYIKIKIDELPGEATYADDGDFLTEDEEKKNLLNNIVKDILLEDNLVVNENKTEHTIIVRCKNKIDEKWRNVKKLGSLLGDSEDIARRKQLAIVANKALNQLWIRTDKLSLKIRLKIYNSLVRSILLYNCGTWGISKKEEDNLNAFHRKQIRYVLKIHHPHHISNKNLYRITEDEPVSLYVLKARWRLFGHELRSENDAPSYKSMKYYFSETIEPKFQGRPRMTLPLRLNADLKTASQNIVTFFDKYSVRELKSVQDLQRLCMLASNRKLWQELTKEIYDVAKANISC